MTKVSRNRRGVINNSAQKDYKRVLCVCSAGVLRSPTLAVILAGEPFNFNTRAVGANPEYALIPLDKGLIMWANEIVVMDDFHQHAVNQMQHELAADSDGMYDFEYRKVHCFNVEDDYDYRDPELVRILTMKALEAFNGSKE